MIFLTFRARQAYAGYSNSDDVSSKMELENNKLTRDIKSEFLSRMSHEIRTPVNAVIGMTKIAKQSRDEATIKNCLDSIDDSAKHLMTVINDIFDVSKIEANKLELDNGHFNFRKTMSEVYGSFKKQTDGKEQQFTFLLDESINNMYIGDEARLAQVVSNLLSNAVKFTPEKGSISLSAKQRKTAEGKVIADISISDTGIGISKENLVKMFYPFEQIDGSITRKYGGIGLGLTLCKSIVELMGGEIDVKSEVGKGSTFAFSVEFMLGDKISGEIIEADSSQTSAKAHGNEVTAPAESAAETPAVAAGHADGETVAEVKNYDDFDNLLPFINVKRGLENLKGNKKLYAILLKSYQKNDMHVKIQEFVSKHNFREAVHYAQALKSVTINIALDDLRMKMEMLEEPFRSLTSDDALMNKLKISAEETQKRLPGLMRVLEEGKL